MAGGSGNSGSALYYDAMVSEGVMAGRIAKDTIAVYFHLRTYFSLLLAFGHDVVIKEYIGIGRCLQSSYL